ncbi:MAG: hypothetical protein OXG43_07615 [Chloroflexi bacterium]|nr:hypothetical protein [Chloroflexota bacterium]
MRLLIGTREGLRDGEGATLGLGGRAIRALAGRPDDAWMVVDGREVWRVQGRRLTPATAAGALGDPALTCVLPTRAGVLVGTEGAYLRRFGGRSRLGNEALAPVAGFDEAEGREHWFTPWGGPAATRTLAVDKHGGLYVNVHVGGVLRSDDDGESWQATALDISADAHQVIAPAGHDGLLLAATARGLAVSRDRGGSWELDVRGLHATYARAVALSGSTILLSVARGPGGQDAALYRRSLDGDEPFVRCRDGLPDHFDGNIDTHTLVADGADAAFAGPDGAIYCSDDGGYGWEQTLSGLSTVYALLIERGRT